MIDYSKYEVVKTKKIINSNSEVRYNTTFKTQEEQVNNAIEYLIKTVLKSSKLLMIM